MAHYITPTNRARRAGFSFSTRAFASMENARRSIEQSVDGAELTTVAMHRGVSIYHDGKRIAVISDWTPEEIEDRAQQHANEHERQRDY